MHTSGLPGPPVFPVFFHPSLHDPGSTQQTPCDLTLHEDRLSPARSRYSRAYRVRSDWLGCGGISVSLESDIENVWP